MLVKEASKDPYQPNGESCNLLVPAELGSPAARLSKPSIPMTRERAVRGTSAFNVQQ